jgi:hypothetical protein
VAEKSAESKALVRLVSTLDSMGLTREGQNLSKPEAARIDRLLSGLSSSEDLFKIAVITKTISMPGAAEHQDYDDLFDAVFWICARKLSEKNDDSSVRNLSELKRIFGTDGSDSLRLRELVQRQDKLPKATTK